MLSTLGDVTTPRPQQSQIDASHTPPFHVPEACRIKRPKLPADSAQSLDQLLVQCKLGAGRYFKEQYSDLMHDSFASTFEDRGESSISCIDLGNPQILLLNKIHDGTMHKEMPSFPKSKGCELDCSNGTDEESKGEKQSRRFCRSTSRGSSSSESRVMSENLDSFRRRKHRRTSAGEQTVADQQQLKSDSP